MLTQQTVEKLGHLKLHGMAQVLQEQLERGDVGSLSFEERLGLMVDREWTDRQNRSLTRRLQLAKLKVAACVEDINYRHPRGIDKGQVQDLSSCRWIAAHRNLIVTGATGLGKTWLACAFGNKACRESFTTVYYRVPRLVEELSVAKADGTYLKTLAAIARTDVLILDDWGLLTLNGAAQHNILEVIDDRAGTRSTIVTSQLPIAKWHDTIGDPSVADAMLDRLLGTSTHIPLAGETMRNPKAKKS
jgi:DNA replication protein DnaC